MEYRPLAYWPARSAFLVERFDHRAQGTETSWMLYDRTINLVAYVTVLTEAGVSDEHIQWVDTGADKAAQAEWAKLISTVRQKLGESDKAAWPATMLKILKEQPGWVALKPLKSCPVKASKKGTQIEISAFEAATRASLPVALIDATPSPAEQKKGCAGASLAGPLRCAAGEGRDVLVVVPFHEECGGKIEQQQLVLFDPAAVEFVKEAQLGEQALKKKDLAGAKAHFEKSLSLDGKYDPARFQLACTLALSGVSFVDGRKELEQLLGSEDQRLSYLPKIKSDAALARWRNDPDFARWVAQFPTRR